VKVKRAGNHFKVVDPKGRKLSFHKTKAAAAKAATKRKG
jgi:hypothetical protein